MKVMGRHLQQVSDELELRLSRSRIRRPKAMLAKESTGCARSGRLEELDRDKSMRRQRCLGRLGR